MCVCLCVCELDCGRLLCEGTFLGLKRQQSSQPRRGTNDHVAFDQLVGGSRYTKAVYCIVELPVMEDDGDPAPEASPNFPPPPPPLYPPHPPPLPHNPKPPGSPKPPRSTNWY